MHIYEAYEDYVSQMMAAGNDDIMSFDEFVDYVVGDVRYPDNEWDNRVGSEY